MSGAADPRVIADRYELGDRIGAGGMADVHRATDRVLHRDVAVKLLRDTADEETDRLRFTAEARTLAQLSHRHLVMVLDAGTTADQPFLVMELVEGTTLSQRASAAGGSLPPAEVAGIGAQLAEAIAYAHAQGVIHRDVKPGNVLLGPGGVKLADFGIARLVGDTVRHTRTGQAIGTAAYLAPEQVRGADLTPAADVYALGLVLLEVLTGERAYPGSATEAALARLHRPPHVPDTLPAPWPRLLTEMTAMEPGDRPGAGEVASRLRAPADESAGTTRLLPVEAAPPPLATSPARPRPGAALLARAAEVPPHVRNVALAITAIVVLIVVAAFASSDGTSGSSGGTDTSGTPGTTIPADTPSDLRDPLQDLHDAVLGTGR